LNITASANPAAICNGQSSQLTSTATGGTPAYNILWTPGNLPGSPQTVAPTTTTTFTATVVDANGCTANASTTVTVNPAPSASLTGSILSGCVPLCVNFNDVSTVAAPGVISSWSWDFGDGSLISSAQNPVHCYTTAGVYSVILTVTTTDGCTSTITMPNYISVFVNPVAAFGASPQPTTILDPWITFTDSSLNATSWLWSFGDLNNSTSTLQNPTFAYPDVDCYQVYLTVSTPNGCMDSTSKEICIEPDVRLYVPNAFTPNGDGINDVFIPVGMGIDPENYQMWIFDRWGNLIFTTTDFSKGWDGTVQGTNRLCQIDTYVWKIKGLDMNSGKINLIGRVSLVK
jgi:gliding motility-associated-like protein